MHLRVLDTSTYGLPFAFDSWNWQVLHFIQNKCECILKSCSVFSQNCVLLVLFSTVKTFIFLGILSVRHMAWLGICYFKQQLLSLSLLTSILQAKYQYKSISYDLETPSVYVLIKCILLVNLSYIYSVNQSSVWLPAWKKKIFGIIAGLEALYTFSPSYHQILTKRSQRLGCY